MWHRPDETKRVCHNAQIERFTPVTDNCSRGNFFKKGVLTHLLHVAIRNSGDAYDETGKSYYSSHVFVIRRNIKDENKGVTRESLAVSSIQVTFGDKNLTLLAGWYFRKTAVTH